MKPDFRGRPPPWSGAALAVWLLAAGPARAETLLPYIVTGDAITAPLGGLSGDPARGRALLLDRQKSLCVLCHATGLGDPHLQGDLAPDLSGAGARWSREQMRLRLVEPARFNPATMMPSAYSIDGLANVAARYRGQPLLSAQEIEDIIAYLAQPGG